jgi:hypothetical protein
VIAVSETVLGVTFYNRQRQHAIAERLVAFDERMHHIADFQFGVARIAVQGPAAGAEQLGELRAELDSFQAPTGAESEDAELAARSLTPGFESLVLAYDRFDRSPTGTRQTLLEILSELCIDCRGSAMRPARAR